MYEWHIKFSETTITEKTISCEMWTATIYAVDEDEVRTIFAEYHPGKSLDEIVRGERIED